jgi:hypothetical protein
MIATLVKAGTAARCDLSILFLNPKSKDRSVPQLLQDCGYCWVLSINQP